MKWRRWLVGMVVGLIFIFPSVAFASEQLRVIVNGKEVQFDVQPQIVDGRIMVPLRFVAQALGAEVNWDAERNTVEIKSQGNAQSVQHDSVAQWEQKTEDIMNKVISVGRNLSKALEEQADYLQLSKIANETALNINPILQQALAIIPPPEKKEAHNFLIEYIKAKEGYYNAYSYWAMHMYFGKDNPEDLVKAKTRANEARYYEERATAMFDAFYKYK